MCESLLVEIISYTKLLRELILFLHVTVLDAHLLIQGLICCNRDNLVFHTVLSLCLTKSWTMMERRRALTIPFTVDKDSLVCVAHSFDISSFHGTHVN